MRKSITRAAAAGSSMFDIQNGRQQLAQQFSAMDGWQRGTDPRFDEFVDKQRTRERYEAFDQRVERAYLTCTTLHKAEVTNGFKRHLTSTGTKFDASVLREMNQAIESRLEWLREVWAQIDADYRSTDTARQEAASQEISRALRGEPSDYMAWAYERKQDARRKGPKGKVALESEFEDTNLPTVSDDEANRYLNLRINMLEIERRVKEKFGIAGQQHWGELQAQKDRDYEEKLDQSVEKYKELLDQQSRYDESKRHTPLRQVLERTHEANVRFRAAMEMEQERERLLEAHKEMTEERQKATSERRKLQLRDAAELRAAGKTSEEVVQMMKLKAYDEQVQQQDSYRRQEKREIQKKKDTFLTMIEKLRRSSEEREGRDLMQPQLQRSTTPSQQRPVSAFGFADDDVYDAHTLTRANEAGATAVVDGSSSSNDPFRLTAEEQTLISKSISTRIDGRQQELSSTTNNNVNKRQLWNSINADRYEDPFTTVHQARMDADKNYDQLYAKMLPTQLIPGSGRMSRQGMGDMAAGNEQDRQILQGGQMYNSALQWDNPHGIVHNLDGDGEKEYFLSDVFHIRDKKTGDIDWRFERRSGGVTMRGPKFYKPGERRAATDPGSKTVEPMPSSAKLGANGKKIRRSTPSRSE